MENISSGLTQIFNKNGLQIRSCRQVGERTYELITGQGQAMTVFLGTDRVWFKDVHSNIFCFEKRTEVRYSLGATAASRNELAALSTGKVQRIFVKKGDLIKQGTVLLKIESMKMEVEVRAPQQLTITDIRVQEGDFVRYGGVLISFKDDPGAPEHHSQS